MVFRFDDLNRKSFKRSGYTIFELIVVVIGFLILAAIVPLVFSNNQKPTIQNLPESVIDYKLKISLLKTDLVNAVSQLQDFKSKNGNFPRSNNCELAQDVNNICLKPAQGSVFNYSSDGMSFTLYGSKDGVKNSYLVSDSQTNPSVITN